MAEYLTRQYRKGQKWQFGHQNCYIQMSHKSHHPSGSRSLDFPLPFSPPSLTPSLDLSPLLPHPPRDPSSDLSGIRPLRTLEACSNPQADPVSGNIILPPHHSRQPPFLYIPPQTPPSHRSSWKLQNQSGKAVSPEKSSFGSIQSSHSPDCRISNQRDHPPLPSEIRYKANRFIVICSLTCALPVMAENRQQNEAQGGEARRGNPLDRVLANDTCTLCQEHCFMIARFVKHHNELREDFIADSRSKRKKLEKRKKEIEALKDKCEHLEEAVKHIQSLTESMQAEASTKDSQKDQQKDDQMEDTVNQFWC